VNLRKSLIVVAALLLCVGLSSASWAQGVLFVANDNVGVGTDTPDRAFHIERAGDTTPGSDAGAKMLLHDTGSSIFRAMLEMRNTGGVGFRLLDLGGGAGCGANCIDFNNILGEFRLNFNDGDGPEFRLTAAGNIILPGGQLNVPDYVFEPDYQLMPLSELAQFVQENKHLPNIPSKASINDSGEFNVTELQLRLLEKVEELTLYTLQQESRIAELSGEVEKLRQQAGGD
jgi:hypothetical protein